MVDPPVYLDNHATTRVDPRVVEAMLPYFSEIYGNASSAAHRFGWEAAEAVERAREQVAGLIRADPGEIIFTSGATEANNLAIKGAAWSLRTRGDHLVSANTEHRAVLDPLKRLAREDGFRLSLVPADPTGQVPAEAVAGALTDRAVLVSVMAANNEVGTLNPIGAIGRVCRERGVLVHTDAAQAAGTIAIDVEADAIDLLSLSGHKFHGPKGIGALYVRRRGRPARLVPLIDGGGHERGLRSGTLPVPLIVGLGRAAELARAGRDDEAARLRALRDRLLEAIREGLGDHPAVRLNGHRPSVSRTT